MGLQEEITELEQRFAEAPDSRLFLPLADALSRAGEYHRAVKLCREGLERYPKFTSARILLGECLAEIGNMDGAARELQAAAEQDPGNRRIVNKLAEISEEGGDPDRAEKLRENVRSEPAEQNEDSERPETAAEPESAGEDESESAEAGRTFISHTLGDIYRMQGLDDKAYEVYSSLLESGRAGPEVKRKLEEVADRLGRAEPAERAAEPAGRQGEEPKPEPTEHTPAVTPEIEGGFEERIDAIFHFLLGDTPDSETGVAAGGQPAAAPESEEGFVDMLEHWIGSLREEVR